ncbi:MAG: hypothetical protein EOO20_28895, partial [Chryseobacterium sp.]
MRIIILCFLLVFNVFRAQAQVPEFTVEKIQSKNGKPNRIFFTALWCSPCMGKYKVFVDSLAQDTSYNNYVMFDRMGFSTSKLMKMQDRIFDTTRSFLVPYEHYVIKKGININVQSKALARLMQNIKSSFHSDTDFKKFWCGDLLFVNPANELSWKKISYI